MKKITQLSAFESPSADYPLGSIKDDPNGTPLDRAMLGDLFQLINKVFSDYSTLTGTPANGLPDNETNGYQLYDAFQKMFKGYYVYTANLTQGGTSAPTAEILKADFGINWSYNSVGDFRGEIIDLPGGGPVDISRLTVHMAPARSFPFGQKIADGFVSPDDVIIQTTSDISVGTPANGIMTRSFVEVRYYF